MKTLGWWDFGWYAADGRHSTGTRRVVKMLAEGGVNLKLVGVPRKATDSPEESLFAGLRGDTKREQSILDRVVKPALKKAYGFDVAHRAHQFVGENLAKLTAAELFNEHRALVVRVGPAGFLEPKLRYAAVIARGLLGGLNVYLLDEDAGVTTVIESVSRILGPKWDQLSRNLEVWGPYVRPVWPRQKFVFWPLAAYRLADAGMVSVMQPRFDVGYVGNHWAANGPNKPHFERLFTPIYQDSDDVKIGVWGEWPESQRPDRDRRGMYGITWHDPVIPSAVEGIYSQQCLAGLLMVHGKKGWPHLTPRVCEVIAAGRPLLWDGMIEQGLPERCPVLDPELQVQSADDLAIKVDFLRGLSHSESHYLVERQRSALLNMPGGRMTDWLELVSEA